MGTIPLTLPLTSESSETAWAELRGIYIDGLPPRLFNSQKLPTYLPKHPNRELNP